MSKPYAGSPPDVVDRIVAHVGGLDDALFDLARDLYEHPELGFDEVHAVEVITGLLARHDVTAATGEYGLATAFRADSGGDGPVVAILAEYDALPGIGHGCGHNLIAATAVGAFLATRSVVADIGGCVRLIGTPAEEGGGGKELIRAAGGFDDVDAAVMVHPGDLDVADPSTIVGRRTARVTYHGKPSHASMQPHLGRNALDAAVHAYQGIAQLRQHILPTDRVHGIISDGGQAVNIVPERASLELLVRSADAGTLAELSRRVDDVLRAAALSTGTECEVSWDTSPAYLPLRTSEVLAGRYIAALGGRRDVRPSLDPMAGGGSTDMGNVSHWVPAIQPMISLVSADVPGHSAEFAEHTLTPAGRRLIVDGAIAVACVAADFLSDQRIHDDARLEFELAGGRVSAFSALSGRNGHRGSRDGDLHSASPDDHCVRRGLGG